MTPWHCPHGLTSLQTCAACGRHVRVYRRHRVVDVTAEAVGSGVEPRILSDRYVLMEVEK